MKRLYTQEETHEIISKHYGKDAYAIGQEYAESNGKKYTTAIFWTIKGKEENFYSIHEIA